MSYVRTRADRFSIDRKVFENTDIHIHLPEGAIPKDGPSAGVAMFTALASLLLNRPVRRDVAMTGEITLRGLVLPIGGLKEKTLAAKRAGIKEVIVPRRNEKDLPDIPDEVRNTLKFHFVDTVDDALEIAVGARKRQPAAPKAGAAPVANGHVRKPGTEKPNRVKSKTERPEATRARVMKPGR